MTFEETRDVLKLVKAEYPQSFKGITKEDAEAKLQLWAEMFAADDYETVKSAVKAIIVAGGQAFAPNISRIKEQINLIEPRKNTGVMWQKAINAKRCRDAADELGSVSRYARENNITWEEARRAT